MTITVQAVYENGVLKLSEPLPLKDGESVVATVETSISWAQRTAGLLKWTGDPEVLRQIAEDDDFSVREAR
ncbi:MAG: antitoxin family protein [Gemmataceae bacterium]